VAAALVVGSMIWYSKSRKGEVLVPAEEAP